MIKSLITLFAIYAMNSLIAQNYWIQRDSVNGPPRGAAASFSLNNEFFAVGGIDVEEFKRKMYSYDLDQDDWDDEVPLGGETGDGLARASAIGFSSVGYGFVGLGAGVIPNMNDLWRYDPSTESWTQMADFIGAGRNGAVAFTIDSITFVGTGLTTEGITDDFYAYNAFSNSWTTISAFPGGARREAAGFTMGGKGYLGTGRGDGIYFADFWEYNPLTDTWTEKAALPGVPRMGAAGCGNFPRAYIMCGETNTAYLDDVWEYNYFGDIWTQRADFPGGERTQANAEVVDGKVFMGLGYNGVYHDDFYEYAPMPVGINENNTQSYLKVYPNPARDYFVVQFNQKITPTQINIFDATGKLVTDKFELTIISNKEIKVNTTSRETLGLYFIQIAENDKVQSLKVLIQ